MANTVKVGIVGLGYWGKNILRNLHELGALAVACDSNTDTIKKREKDFPSVRYTSSYSDMLNDVTVTAVAISTPARTHYEMVKAALNAGKDVFVEKPLALTSREGKELVELAKLKRKVLMVGHILQYHPAVIKLKELIDAGELGKIEYIYSNRLNMGMLRHEENIIWSFAPHDVSAILMLLNEFPTKIRSFGGEYLKKGNGVFDTTLTALEFKSGIKAHIFVSWLHPFKEQRLVVVGNKKMAVFDDMTDAKLFLYPHKVEWNGHIPTAKKAVAEPVSIAMDEPLKRECLHFLDCIRERKVPVTDGEEGLRTLTVLSMAEESLKKDEEIKYASVY